MMCFLMAKVLGSIIGTTLGVLVAMYFIRKDMKKNGYIE